jgi:hypothetical protein
MTFQVAYLDLQPILAQKALTGTYRSTGRGTFVKFVESTRLAKVLLGGECPGPICSSKKN